jgi:hypothetical protein
LQILYCSACKETHVIPNAGIPLDEVNPLVEELVLRHTERNPMTHGSEFLEMSPFRLCVVSDQEWYADSKACLEKAAQNNTTAGFSSADSQWMYDAKDTYSEDALKCFNEHHRPDKSCRDFMSEAKRLGRPTEIGRTALADVPKKRAQEPHLCHFCPFMSHVRTENNWKRGMYQ